VKRYLLILFPFFVFINRAACQDNISNILFHGLVMDAVNETPLSGTQIFINKAFFYVSDNEGKFAFYVARNDTVVFARLGYKPVNYLVSDTLKGSEFIAGIYMQTDTLSAGKVIIIPRFSNLKSGMLAPRTPVNTQTENARFNLAVSAYSGRVSQGKMGDPSTNYEILRRKLRNDAFSKGQISSDDMVSISPLLLIPAAYLLMNGLPQKPAPVQPHLTEYEVDQLHKKYLETLKKK